MNNEQIKEEIKDLSYGIQFHRGQGDFHHGVADKRAASVQRLEAELAKAEKPELRHGDVLLKPLDYFKEIGKCSDDRTIQFRACVPDNLYVAIRGVGVFININIPLEKSVNQLRRLLHTQEQNAKP